MREPLATSAEVAAYLRVKPATLDDWAYRRTGPRFMKVGGRRRYAWPDVDAWLANAASSAPRPASSADGNK